MLIACDIGGVVKEMMSDEPIFNAIESIKQLELLGHKVIFVSKCEQKYIDMVRYWLDSNDLRNNEAYFCDDYDGKKEICDYNDVDYMIDSKLQIFKEMTDKIKKIWLCSDAKKISGAKKYQNDEVERVTICGDWASIVNVISG